MKLFRPATEREMGLFEVYGLLCCVSALSFVLEGCTGSKPKNSPTQLSNYATTAIPLPPETPDTTPIKEDLRGIKEDVSAAQGGIRSVIAVAQTSPLPAIKAAVSTLTASDARLTQATAKADKGTADSVLVDAHIAAIKAYYEQAMKAKDDDNARLLKVAQDDAKTAAGSIASLSKENEDLKNEVLRSAKMRLMALGILLMVVGAGGIIAVFALSFPGGFVIAKIALPLGALLVAIANVLDKIVLGVEITLAVSAAVGLAIVAWELFKHPHPPPVPVTTNTGTVSTIGFKP